MEILITQKNDRNSPALDLGRMPRNLKHAPSSTMPRVAPSIKETLAALTSVPEASSTASRRQYQAPLRIHFPSTVVSAPGTRLSRDAAASAPTFSVAASALGNLTFPNCDLSPVTSASSVGSDGVSDGSALAAATPRPDPDDVTPRFLVVSLDLDPPFPSFPVLGPLLHGMQADLTLAMDDILDPDDGFIGLRPATTGDGDGDGDGGPVVEYIGPSTPGMSSPHRYIFMLWEQPAGITGKRIKEHLGFSEDGEAGLMARVRWDQEEFERKVGLWNVVAGNYFVC